MTRRYDVYGTRASSRRFPDRVDISLAGTAVWFFALLYGLYALSEPFVAAEIAIGIAVSLAVGRLLRRTVRYRREAGRARTVCLRLADVCIAL